MISLYWGEHKSPGLADTPPQPSSAPTARADRIAAGQVATPECDAAGGSASRKPEAAWPESTRRRPPRDFLAFSQPRTTDRGDSGGARISRFKYRARRILATEQRS